MKPKSLDTWKVLLKGTAKQAEVEASEEIFTEIANILSDAAVMGATSDFAVMTKEHQKGGVSKEVAKRRALLDCVGQVAWASAGGAISGGIMGGVTNLAGYIKQTRALGSGGNRMELLPGARRSGGGLPPLAKGSRAGAPIKLNSVDSAVFGGYDGIKKGGVSDEAARASAQRQEADSGGGVSGLSERVGEVERAGIFGREDSFASGFIRLSDESLAKIAQSGVVGVDLEDRSADSAAFSSALEAARAADSRNGWAVTPKTAEELSGDKVLLSKSGASGLAVTPDGDIVAVFNNKAAGGPKGATKVLIPTAVANGGVKLDCYGADLVDIYAQYGFVPVARVAFDAEYANEGWTPDKGTPDIYFMVHNGDRADVVVDKMGQYPQYALEQLQGLPLMDYEGAAAYRDSLLSKIAPTDGAVIAQKPASTGEAVKADTSRFDSGILANLNKARKYFIEYAKTHFPASVVNVETGTEIGISRTGLDKFLSGRIAKEKYASGFYIPELIERARKVGQADNYHVKKVRSIPTYEYYDSPISIDGMDYIAHIRVKNTTMGDKYYGHTISEVEDIKIEPSARTPASETPTG